MTKAIEILIEEYYGRLSNVDFSAATDVLSDEVKASVFVTLSIKEARDSWLEKHANIFLI